MFCIFIVIIRVVLQFSALCQCTMKTNSQVIERLLTLLTDTLNPLLSNATRGEVDTHCAQWLTLLLSHVLSSGDTKHRDSNLFVPTLPPLSPPSSSSSTNDQSSDISIAKTLHRLSRLEEAHERVKVLSSKATELGNTDAQSSLASLKSELEKMEKKLNKVYRMQQQRERGKEPPKDTTTTSSQTDSQSGGTGMSLQLSDVTLKASSEGLTCLLIRYCKNTDWERIPIVCKVSI